MNEALFLCAIVWGVGIFIVSFVRIVEIEWSSAIAEGFAWPALLVRGVYRAFKKK